MKLTTIAWLAGLIEGEGCFYFRIRHVPAARGGIRIKKTALITISSTDKDIIYRISNLWSSSIYKKYGGVNKDYYTTVINGRRAIGWMFTIYSFMGIRRRKKN